MSRMLGKGRRTTPIEDTWQLSAIGEVKNRSFEDSTRLFLLPGGTLQPLYRAGREKFFPALGANLSRNVLDDNPFAIKLNSVSNLLLNQWRVTKVTDHW